jgi:hypothetical protein
MSKQEVRFNLGFSSFDMTFFARSLRLLLVVGALFLGAGSRLLAQAPTWQDATSPGNGVGYRTTVDAAGNTYVAGIFGGTATFGSITLTGTGGLDVFVAKRSPAGVWLWATGAGGIGTDYGFGVAIDGSGSVVVSGHFDSPTIPFGATTLTNGPPRILPLRLFRLETEQ